MESNHQPDELPPKKEIYLHTKLSESQTQIYQELLSKISTSDETQNTTFYLNALMQLRKVCNHLYMFDKGENGIDLINSSGKMIILDKLLEKLFTEKHRVVIFSQMAKVLDILQDYCLFRKYNYCRIDGSMVKKTRDEQLNEFVKPGSDKFLLIISTRAGGLGIDLSVADTVILYDSDWNPIIDEQAVQRVHRVGQKNAITIYRMVTERSIEEKILEHLLKKQQKKVDLTTVVSAKDKTDMLKNISEYEKDELSSEDGGKQVDEVDIDDYLEKSEIRTWEIKSKFGIVEKGNEKYEKED